MRDDRDDRAELLEYLLGCHPDEADLQARLETDPELRASLERARSDAAVLEDAARAGAPVLDLDALEPLVSESAPARHPAPRRIHVVTSVIWAASILFFALLAAPWIDSALAERRAERAEEAAWSLRVDAAHGAPPGTPVDLSVRAESFTAEPEEVAIEWTLHGETVDAVRASQRAIRVAAELAVHREIEVVARSRGVERTVTVPLGVTTETPLAHLSSDKPIYRPGERAWMRAVLLDRLTLHPAEGRYRLRVVDPKGAPVERWTREATNGVVPLSWHVPADAVSGTYELELRDARNDFPVETLSFLVQRFRPPQLEKELILDRESYAPGSVGAATLSARFLSGGSASGARVSVRVFVDGESVDEANLTLDEEGLATFAFDVPRDVEGGAGRVACRVAVGGVIETIVEPFTVPTEHVEIRAYPEGGELVAGVASRVYIETTDAAGRPIRTSGALVDALGARVAQFTTEHQGRGRVTFVPEDDTEYAVVLNGPAADDSISLPRASRDAASLHALADSFTAAEPIAFEVRAPSAGAWTLAAFCRGVLVGTTPVSGGRVETVALDVPDHVSGVLRVTLFDASVTPVAERLVHRASDRRISVAIEPAKANPLPGEHQTIDLIARDEHGNPAHCVLGIGVVDAAVRAASGEPRLSLYDQALLFEGVESLENAPPFALDDEDAALRIDLLLGTRGWRRFAWVDPLATVEEYGDAGKRLLVREGNSAYPRVRLAGAEARRTALEARSVAKRRRARATSITLFVAAIAVIGLLATTFTLGLRRSIGVAAYVLGPLAAIGITGASAYFLAPNTVEFLAGEDVLRAGIESEVPSADAVLPSFEDVVYDTELPDRAIPSDLALMERTAGPRRIRIYAHRNTSRQDVRDDFTETVYWNPLLVTDDRGRAQISFDLSDRATRFDVTVDAHGAGRVGSNRSSFLSVPPLAAEAKLPIELSAGDVVHVPVAVEARDESLSSVAFDVRLTGPIAIVSEPVTAIELSGGRGRALVSIEALDTFENENGTLEFTTAGGGWTDAIQQDVRVVPRGFPHHVARSGIIAGAHETTLSMPKDHVPGTLFGTLTVYPSPLTEVLAGLEGMLRQPHGCFEQTSSVNYPNVLALTLLEATGRTEPALARRARALLADGYARLVSFECDGGGFEWFGANPAHESLTAYGLLQFHDMAAVYDVDTAVIERTREWLLSRRDGSGGFERANRGDAGFGGTSADITSAYVTYSLALTGTPPRDLRGELDRLESRALESNDPYEVALATSALHASGRAGPARAARVRLAQMQDLDGSLVGASSSITASGGDDLRVETTALAISPWLDDPDFEARARAALQWLVGQRGRGRFGATQATVQALRALVDYTRTESAIDRAGDVRVLVRGEEVARVPYSTADLEPIVVPGLARHLEEGDNDVRFEVSGGASLPFALDLEYVSDQPADEANCPLSISAVLAPDSVREGDVVIVDVSIRNDAPVGQPMTIAAVGLPAALACPPRVLDALVRAGTIDFWETRGRDVLLYWRGLAPESVLELSLECEARIPGTTVGPASRIYRYYEPDSMRWAEPLTARVRSGR